MKLTARQRRIIDPIRETDIPPFPVRKFTVTEYHQLLKARILLDGDPYELLRGWIVRSRRPAHHAPQCVVTFANGCSKLSTRPIGYSVRVAR
jgi:hypothetical protein